jgi:Zn finger protein HypA/HybF involved in hydrogenase expression
MGIYETLKSTASVLREADKIEQYRQILDAMQNLLEMQNKLSKLEQENESLKEKLKIKEAGLTLSNNAYWLKSNKDGPFCTRCWDKNNELIRLKKDYECPECKNKYGPKQIAKITNL